MLVPREVASTTLGDLGARLVVTCHDLDFRQQFRRVYHFLNHQQAHFFFGVLPRQCELGGKITTPTAEESDRYLGKLVGHWRTKGGRLFACRSELAQIKPLSRLSDVVEVFSLKRERLTGTKEPLHSMESGRCIYAAGQSRINRVQQDRFDDN